MTDAEKIVALTAQMERMMALGDKLQAVNEILFANTQRLVAALKEIKATATPLDYGAGYIVMKKIAEKALKDVGE